MTDKFEHFPSYLKRSARFCLWRYETKDGRPTKMPYNPKTGARAQTNDPETFTDFETAAAVLERNKGSFMGLGMGIFGDLAAIDIDHCRNKDTGELTPEAAEIIEQVDGYTETSPSGEGVHIYAPAAKLAEAVSAITRTDCTDAESWKRAFGNRWYNKTQSGLEFYAGFSPRYLTITGDAIRGGNLSYSLEKTDKAQALVSVLDKFYRRGGEEPPNTVDLTAQRAPLALTDQEIIDRAFNGKNGAEFRALWDGDTSKFNGDDSRADLALLSHLAFWTGGDHQRMEDLFSKSGLNRDKWRNRRDYREASISKALEGMRNFYSPEEYYHSDPRDDFSVETDEPQKTAEERKDEYLRSSAYFNVDDFFGDIRDRAATPAIPTGFRRLDDALDGGLYEGLYIIGGISSVGKTAFCLQLMDQIAASGHDVLIFSLEMSRFELMARSISRWTFQLLKQREGFRRYNAEKFYPYAKTARGITAFEKWRYYKMDALDLITQAAEKYRTAAKNLWIFEGLGTTGVIDTKDSTGVRSTVEAHIAYTGSSPVVLVDYLQILEPYSERMTDKQNTDKAVKLLKIMSRDFKIPVIAISSFNRANYKTAVDMEAFKESGAIEYSSDVLIGLQLYGAGTKDFDVTAAKKQDPRNIEALILKNRNGATGIDLHYHYYPKYNAYKEYELKPPTPKNENLDIMGGVPIE